MQDVLDEDYVGQIVLIESVIADTGEAVCSLDSDIAKPVAFLKYFSCFL